MHTDQISYKAKRGQIKQIHNLISTLYLFDKERAYGEWNHSSPYSPGHLSLLSV